MINKNRRLSCSLMHQHRYLTSFNSRGRQTKASLQLVRQHVFEYLSKHPALAKRDFKPEMLTEIKNCDAKVLRLSKRTLYSTGMSWQYYIKMFRSTESLTVLKQGIDRFLNGNVSTQAYLHVRLLDVIQFAKDLKIPVEYLIYGTLDINQIASYNWRFSKSLSRLSHTYVKMQVSYWHLVPDMLRQLHKKLSYQEIHQKIGMSRQNIYGYLAGNYKVIRQRASFARLCKLLHCDSVRMITFPIMSADYLNDVSKQYAEHCRKRFA